MRFSLLTLILTTFWLALLLLVAARWSAWEIGFEAIQGEAIPQKLRDRFFTHPIGEAELKVSPDGSRYLYDGPAGSIEIWDIRNQCLVAIPIPDHQLMGFGTDDHILLARFQNFDASPYRYRVLRRRHPEWWWGHLYRPEIWVLIAFTAALGFGRRRLLGGSIRQRA